MELRTVSGLRNLGNTCFLNALLQVSGVFVSICVGLQLLPVSERSPLCRCNMKLCVSQALASAEPLVGHLRGFSAPTESLTHILAQCLEQLLPKSNEHGGSPVSPSAVLEALRSVITFLWTAESNIGRLSAHQSAPGL